MWNRIGIYNTGSILNFFFGSQDHNYTNKKYKCANVKYINIDSEKLNSSRHPVDRRYIMCKYRTTSLIQSTFYPLFFLIYVQYLHISQIYFMIKSPPLRYVSHPLGDILVCLCVGEADSTPYTKRV